MPINEKEKNYKELKPIQNFKNTYKKLLIAGLIASAVTTSCQTNNQNHTNRDIEEPAKINKQENISTEEYFELWEYYASLHSKYNACLEKFIVSSMQNDIYSSSLISSETKDNLITSLQSVLKSQNENKNTIQSFASINQYDNTKFNTEKSFSPADNKEMNLLSKDKLKDISNEITLLAPIMTDRDKLHISTYYFGELIKTLKHYNKIKSPLIRDYIAVIEKQIDNKGTNIYYENIDILLPIIQEKTL